MKTFISKIPNDVQDKNSKAWGLLCEYIDKLAENGGDEFSPREALGNELFSEIYTLPPSIKQLKKVTKVWLYGSNLKRIPPEIGEMEALEYFDPYTSYNLNWFPYEITRCKKLADSRVSTRALYGNYKHRTPFPSLHKNPVIYENNEYQCGQCKKIVSANQNDQFWITLRVGTDYLPLLVNICSDTCKNALPKPDEGYIEYPHKGGSRQEQPKLDEMEYYALRAKSRKKAVEPAPKPPLDGKLSLLKVIHKIWEK